MTKWEFLDKWLPILFPNQEPPADEFGNDLYDMICTEIKEAVICMED